jgi:hypothetical protein
MTPEEREQLGHLLIEEGIVTEEDMSQAVAEGGARNATLAAMLQKCRLPRRTSLAQWLAADYRMPEVPDLRRIDLPASLGQLIPATLARRLQVLPLGRFGSILIVARAAGAKASIQELRKVTGLKVKVVAADPGQVTSSIEHLYGGGKAAISEPGPDTRRRTAAAAAEPEAAESRVDTVPIINVAMSAPPAGSEAAFTEIEEIHPAILIGRAEYEEQARTPFGQLFRAWDDLFRDGKLIKAPRVG